MTKLSIHLDLRINKQQNFHFKELEVNVLRRLRNYYCWNTIEDWIKAQKCGLVKLQQADLHIEVKETDKCLLKLLEMAEDDCFPVGVVCLKKKEGYILTLNNLIYRLFQFLNDEIFLEGEGGEKIFFADFDSRRKGAVLKAQMHSVWIDVFC